MVTVLERDLWVCLRVLLPVFLCLAWWPRMALWLFKTFICQFCELSQTALCHCFWLFNEVCTALQLTLICSIPFWHHGLFFPDLLDILCGSLLLPCHLCHLPSRFGFAVYLSGMKLALPGFCGFEVNSFMLNGKEKWCEEKGHSGWLDGANPWKMERCRRLGSKTHLYKVENWSFIFPAETEASG